MTDCIFCAIVSGDIPSTKVFEDEHVLAFMDIQPASDGHMVVVPKVHSKDFVGAPIGDVERVVAVAQTLAQRALDVLGADGVNVLTNNGSAAWQSVFHLHFHVIPRYADERRDRLRLPWDSLPGDPELTKDLGAKLSASR